MENRISAFYDDCERLENREQGPQPIGEILAELLAQYQIRFPSAQIFVVQTPVATC